MELTLGNDPKITIIICEKWAQLMKKRRKDSYAKKIYANWRNIIGSFNKYVIWRPKLYQITWTDIIFSPKNTNLNCYFFVVFQDPMVHLSNRGRSYWLFIKWQKSEVYILKSRKSSNLSSTKFYLLILLFWKKGGSRVSQ